MIKTIEELFAALQKWTYKELFGEDDDSESSAYRRYATICHPDTCDHPLAKECFQLLAQRKNNKGGESPSLITITSKKQSYSFDKSVVIEGDLSNVYVGEEYLIKISRSPKVNSLLVNEKDILEKVYPKDDGGFSFFQKYLPQIHDSFDVVQTNKVNLRCNIFVKPPNFNSLVSLEKLKKDGCSDIPPKLKKFFSSLVLANKRSRPDNILELHKEYKELLERLYGKPKFAKFNKKIDGKAFAWIFNRLFEILSYIHTQEYLYLNLTPNTILVDTEQHGILLSDWGNAAKLNSPAKFVNKKYTPFFPVEIIKKEECGYETDLFMLGSLASFLYL